VAVVAAGCAALLARPWLVRLPVDPVALLVVLFVVLGVVGAAWRLPAARGDEAGPGPGAADEGARDQGDQGARSPLPAWLALGIGLGAFGAGRLLAAGSVPVAPFVVRSVALNSLAAVSEEAFFRRFAYGLAAVRGPAVAVVASAAIFAAVHVTVWGWAVLPLDLAAGLVLGWQRWASGGWSVPAATHVAANVLAVL
jgi:membrane protease YdiL (CAAX protease family)